MKLKRFKLFESGEKRAKVEREENKEGYIYSITLETGESIILELGFDDFAILNPKALNWLQGVWGSNNFVNNDIPRAKEVTQRGHPLSDEIYNELKRVEEILKNKNKYAKRCGVQLTHNNQFRVSIGKDVYLFRQPLKWGDNEWVREEGYTNLIDTAILLNSDQKELISKILSAGRDKTKDYIGFIEQSVYLYPHEIEEIKKLHNMTRE